MSKGFAAGLAARTVDAGSIGQIMAGMRGFSPNGHATPRDPAAPRHFTPAQPGVNPTAGWDMFDAAADVAPVVSANPIEAAIEAARAEGYALGIAAGEVAATAAHAGDDAALALLGAGLSRLKPFDREALAARLSQTVLHLVDQLVGEAGVDADRLLARVKTAATLLCDATQPAILRLNPADLPLVEGRVPDPLFAIGDPTLPRGGLVLESKESVVEDGPATWLAALTAAIERVSLPTDPRAC